MFLQKPVDFCKIRLQEDFKNPGPQQVFMYFGHYSYATLASCCSSTLFK